MEKTKTRRTVIVGGGIIGLSLAYELAKRKHEVVLLAAIDPATLVFSKASL